MANGASPEISKEPNTQMKTFIKNVPPFFNDKDLQALIEKIAPVRRVFIIRRKETKISRGYAFAVFDHEQDRDAVVSKLNGRKIDDNYRLIVDIAKEKKDVKKDSTKLSEKPMVNAGATEVSQDFISTEKKNESSRFLLVVGIPSKIEKKSLAAKFSKIEGIEYLIYPAPESTLVVYAARIIFENEEKAAKGRRMLQTIMSSDRKTFNKKFNLFTMSKSLRLSRLIIRNVPFNIGLNNLRRLFQECGEIKDLKILKNDKGTSKGVAFVEYNSITEASEAIEALNGMELQNRKIVIDWAVSKFHFDKLKLLNEKQEEKRQKRQERLRRKKVDKLATSEPQATNTSEPFKAEYTVDKNKNEAPSLDKTPKLTSGKRKFSDISQGKTLFISGLSPGVTQDEVEAVFAAYGRIRYVRLVYQKMSKTPRGSCFVKFNSKTPIKKIFSKNGNGEAMDGKSAERSSEGINASNKAKQNFLEMKIKGQVCKVSVAVSKDALEEIKKKKMKPSFEDKRNLRLVRNGYVDEKRLKENRMPRNTITKRKKSLAEKLKKLSNPNFYVSKTRVFVKNIPPDWSEKQLRALFSKSASDCRLENKNAKYERRHPKLIQVKIAKECSEQIKTKKDKISKGFGFIEFREHIDALHCVDQITEKVLDRSIDPLIQVEFAVEDSRKVKLREKKLLKTKMLKESIKTGKSALEIGKMNSFGSFNMSSSKPFNKKTSGSNKHEALFGCVNEIKPEESTKRSNLAEKTLNTTQNKGEHRILDSESKNSKNKDGNLLDDNIVSNAKKPSKKERRRIKMEKRKEFLIKQKVRKKANRQARLAARKTETGTIRSSKA